MGEKSVLPLDTAYLTVFLKEIKQSGQRNSFSFQHL